MFATVTWQDKVQQRGLCFVLHEYGFLLKINVNDVVLQVFMRLVSLNSDIL